MGQEWYSKHVQVSFAIFEYLSSNFMLKLTNVGQNRIWKQGPRFSFAICKYQNSHFTVKLTNIGQNWNSRQGPGFSNTNSIILGFMYYVPCCPMFSPAFGSAKIVKPMNTKTAKPEGHLYFKKESASYL